MSSKSDTGHAKNAINLEELCTITGKAGAAYAPSRPELKHAALMVLAGLCTSMMVTVEDAETNVQRLSNDREILFDPLRKFITRILNIVASSGVTQQTKDDLMHLQKKFQGRRATAKKTPTSEELAAGKGKSKSVSQQSYDNLVTHLRKFITLLKAEPLYNPSEDDLKITSLDYLCAQLNTQNKYVKGANKDLSKMRATRQELFYAKDTGMYHIALAVKRYVRGAFTPDSEEFQQINSLKFTDLNDRD